MTVLASRVDGLEKCVVRILPRHGYYWKSKSAVLSQHTEVVEYEAIE